MDIEYLKRFMLVGQTLNFRKASESLFISQPTLSHSISSLEKEIGVPLLERNTKFVKLTPAGARFLQACAEIIKIYDGITTEIIHQADEDSNILHIGYVGPALGRQLSPWVNQIRKENPEIDIRLSRYHGTEMREALESNAVQLAILFEEYADAIPNIHSEVIASEKFKLVVNSESPFASYDMLPLEKIKGEPFIICQRDMSPFYYDKVLSLFDFCHISPRVSQHVRLISDIYRLVDMNLGYAIMSLSDTSFYGNFNLKFINIQGIPDNLLYHNRILAWKGNLTPAAKRFKKIINDNM